MVKLRGVSWQDLNCLRQQVRSWERIRYYITLFSGNNDHNLNIVTKVQTTSLEGNTRKHVAKCSGIRFV